MDFRYQQTFGNRPETGYETLLHDAFAGDSTLFQRADQIEAAWQVVDPILKSWEETFPFEFANYAAGSWGPMGSFQLLEKDSHSWIETEYLLIPKQTMDRDKEAA
jgi:glucose-6-phosphate 1-dehydrogenase